MQTTRLRAEAIVLPDSSRWRETLLTPGLGYQLLGCRDCWVANLDAAHADCDTVRLAKANVADRLMGEWSWSQRQGQRNGVSCSSAQSALKQRATRARRHSRFKRFQRRSAAATRRGEADRKSVV